MKGQKWLHNLVHLVPQRFAELSTYVIMVTAVRNKQS